MKKIVELSKELFEKFKGRLIQAALLKFLPKWIGGIKGWIATTGLSILVDKILKPLYERLVRLGYITVQKIKIKKKVKKYENAKTESDFDDSFDDLP